jgi:hypothetical protein
MSQKRASSFRTSVWRLVIGRSRLETNPMHLKVTLTRGLMLAITLLTSLAVAPLAAEVLSDHSGTICKNYFPGDANLIGYGWWGTYSAKTSDTYVICPLTRNTGNRNGAVVYVDVRHNNTQTTTCAAASVDFDGMFLASAIQTWTGSGLHEFGLNLAGYGKSGPWSHYIVYCLIPGNYSSNVQSVNLVEDP